MRYKGCVKNIFSKLTIKHWISLFGLFKVNSTFDLILVCERRFRLQKKLFVESFFEQSWYLAFILCKIFEGPSYFGRVEAHFAEI